MTRENESSLPCCRFDVVPDGATFFHRGEWWTKEKAPEGEQFSTPFLAVQRGSGSVRIVSLQNHEEVRYSPAN
ncbi:MAG: hypothetical protein AMXMBFR44_4050 [Candidatus Campbellbacteria bacterium]